MENDKLDKLNENFDEDINKLFEVFQQIDFDALFKQEPN